MGNCMPHLFNCCPSCERIFFIRNAMRTRVTINGTQCDAQSLNAKNASEECKTKECKKHVTFANKIEKELL